MASSYAKGDSDWKNVIPSRVVRHWNELLRVDQHVWKCSNHLHVAPGDMVWGDWMVLKVFSKPGHSGFCEAEASEHNGRAGALSECPHGSIRLHMRG